MVDILSKPNLPSGLFKANGVDYLLPPTQRVGIMANDGAGNISWGPSPYPSTLENGDFLNWPNGTSFPAVANGIETARNAYWTTSGVGVVTVSRSTDVPTASATVPSTPYSLLITPTTIDASIGASDLYALQCIIGGAPVRALTNGFAISFLVKAHLAGTYCIAFQNSGQNRSYVAEYAVNLADTWEYKTVVVPTLPTTGTWSYLLAGAGLRVFFTIAAGVTSQTTAGSWQTGAFYATSNQVNAMASVANTVQIALINPVPGAQPYPLSALDGMLFSDTTITTIGFGDTPSSGSGVAPGAARDTHRHGMATITRNDLPTAPEASVTRTVVQSISNGAWNILGFDSERLDNDTIHDNATNNSRLTCKTAGRYFIWGTASFATNANNTRIMMLTKNSGGTGGAGTILQEDSKPSASGVSGFHTTLSVSRIVPLVVNDYVELHVFQDSGGALNINASAEYTPEFGMRYWGA